MKKLTNQEFISRVKKNNPNVTILSNYINTRTKVLAKCNICDYEWHVSPNTIMNGIAGCPMCSGNARKTTYSFKKEIFNINPDIEILGEYINSKTPIKCKCKIDNCVWSPTPSTLLNDEGCPQCFRRRLIKAKTLTHDEFLSKIDKNIIPLSQYIHGKNRWISSVKNVEIYGQLRLQVLFKELVVHVVQKTNPILQKILKIN